MKEFTPCVYVYGLADASGDIRYIGKTKSLWNRYSTHKRATGPHYEKGNRDLGEWLSYVGDDLRMFVLHEVPGSDDESEREAIRLEELEIRSRENLLNVRSAAQRVYTPAAAHAYLAEWLSDTI